MLLNGAQILIEELVKHQVETVFGYPGGTVIDIYDELYKNCDRIDHIISAHEQGATHAADGYARTSGKTGVVIATSGPGATNLVTGIANAYLDSVPLVAITGNVPVSMLGRDSFQEVDIVGVTQPIVKHNYIVRDVTKLQAVLREAFVIASEGRKGPVLVDISKSVQQAQCEYEDIPIKKFRAKEKSYDLSEAIDAIKKCKKPYIYCGGGVIASGSHKQVLALSKKLSAPIGLSMMGITAIPNSYELNLGMSGMHGQHAASMAQSKADLIIAVGVRFSDRATGNVKEYRKRCTIIHIDIDDAELGKNVFSEIGICGDAKKILEDLIEQIPEVKNQEWIDKVLEYRRKDIETNDTETFDAKNIIRLVNQFTDKDTVIATDVGQHQMWVAQYYKFEKPKTLLTSGGLGAMGYGMGAAIGGSIAKGKERVILFTGDGSFGMNLNELATTVTQKLPLVVIILNNGALGMVRQWQEIFYGCRYSSTILNRQTDFVALAEAFGARGYRADHLLELKNVLDHGLKDDAPMVIDCRIETEDNVLPMIPAGGSIKDIIIK